MKKNFYFILLFISSVFFGQDKNKVLIDWSYGEFEVGSNYFVRTPHCAPDNFLFDESKREISFVKKIKTNQEIDENSLKITNISYAFLTKEQLGSLNLDVISSNLQPSIKNSKAREAYFAVLKLNPIIKDGSGFKIITSFEYSFEIQSNLSQSNKTINALSSSVLKNGTWKRFYVQSSGIYKLTKSFLSDLGIDVNGDPRNLKIYGNGGRMIPLLNSTPYPNDLAENAILFNGEQDGVFNDSDYILFYAEGVDNYNADSNTTQNLYEDKSYYYVTISPNPGKRIVAMSQPSQNPDVVYTTFDDYRYYEIDKNNLGRLGRRWFGDSFFQQNEQSFTFNFPLINLANPIEISVQMAGAAIVTTNATILANNQNIGTVNFSPIIPGGPFFADGSLNASFNTTSTSNTITIKYNNNGVPTANAYLDYIRLKAKSFLKGGLGQYRFSNDNAAISIGIGEYQFSNANTISQVWDITDIYNASAIVNNGQSNFNFKTSLGVDKKFIVLDGTDYYSPLKEQNTAIPNQDLKGTVFLNEQGQFQDVDYLIITPASLKSQADRLATYRKNKSGLNVKVIVLDLIYNEFCSGKQDIGAIRNFVKYVYDNASAPDKRVKYLCLFGDASFDFKNRIPNNTNIVPIFQSLYSFSLSSSFISDDYFALMDSNEGTMNGFEGIDLAVGRILASDLAQAEQMVNKIMDYEDPKSYGKWRNNLVMIADDVDKTDDRFLEVDMDFMADNIYSNKPFFNVKKVLSDSYVQETTSGGQKYPKVKEDFINAFEQGSLVIDYLGHGGEDGLAQERIFEKADAVLLKNRFKYPLFITVTCEFTRFDNPYRPTAGEYVYWNTEGGAVAMVTTTRQIGQSTGTDFNKELCKVLYSYNSNNYVSIAEAVRLTKNIKSSSGNNVVSFLGDPALFLAIPKPKVVLTKINDVPIAQSTDVLQALGYVKLSGEVVDEFGNLLTNYNGDLSINVYDKDLLRTTLGNDNIIVGSSVFKINFKTLGETIFRGNASVNNGLFEFGFVVPKDIKVAVGNGRVSFYAKNNAVAEDQTGYDVAIKVGGVNVNAVADTTPPKVRIYMNDESFVSGGITNQSPIFLAFLEDEHGINTASGIGHDIVAYLDGDETKPYILNDYYETELNNYTKGKLKFPFRNLALGLHTLTFKAWDVYNNIIVSELQFIVVGDETLTLTNVLNYPNPFVNYTEFWFTHNKPFEPLQVQVQVMTITGKVVWSKNQTITNEGFTSRDITWDGKDDFGDRIGKGVYVYKLTVKSLLTNKKTEKFEKLVIL